MPTGADAGLSGIHQIMLGLKVIIKNNGIAEMSQIYSPVNQIVIKRTGDTLDEQGKASLRFFINRKAVEKGYVIKAQEKPGWQITQAGKEVYYNWRKSEEGKRILAELSGVKHVPDKKEVAAATEMNKHRLHEILKDYISEIGEIFEKYPQKEFHEPPYFYDVIWREFDGAPRASHVFEIQDKGNLIAALAKLQHAKDIWGSKPFLVIVGEKDRQKLSQIVGPLLAGTFHRLSRDLVVLNQEDTERLHGNVKNQKEILRCLLT